MLKSLMLVTACAYMQPSVVVLPEITVTEQRIAEAYAAVQSGAVQEITIQPTEEDNLCAKVVHEANSDEALAPFVVAKVVATNSK